MNQSSVVRSKPWTPGGAYAVADSTFHDGAVWVCLVKHVASEAFTQDLQRACWRRFGQPRAALRLAG